MRSRDWLRAPPAIILALWPAAAEAAGAGSANGWLVAVIGGLGVVLAAAVAILVGMRRRIAGLSRQGAAATARAERASGLMDSAADGRWLWPAGRSAGNPAAEGTLAPAGPKFSTGSSRA